MPIPVMLATLTDRRDFGEDWLLERKFDGERCVATKHGADVRLESRTGKDLTRGKNTYPGLIGLDKSWQLARELERRAQHALDGFDHRAEPLRSLASFAVERRL